MTTTTKSKINALNPCTSSSSNCSNKKSKEESIETSDEDKTQVNISKSQQVEPSGNQNQATNQEELNPQDNNAIGPQASKDNPLPGLPTPAQSPEPQPNITTASTNREPQFEHVLEKEARPRQEIRGDIDNSNTKERRNNNKLATSCQGIPACRYAVITIDTSTKFTGAMIDTRASKRSTAGHGQFLAFQRLDTGVQLDTTTQGIG